MAAPVEVGMAETAAARADAPDIAAQFTANTDAARALGIFGAPNFVCDGEVFWGDDRLEDAIAWRLRT